MEILRGLLALGASLATSRVEGAERAALRRALVIQARVSQAALVDLRRGISVWPPGPDDHVVFCSFAPSLIHVGETFVAARTADGKAVDGRCTLVAATQQWGKPWDAVPRGHKSVCVVRSSGALAAALAALPEREDWSAEPRLWLVR